MNDPQGSKWRKWDLHVHTPFTKCNNGFTNSETVWEDFCRDIENSDVQMVGITDYFSLENYFTFIKKFRELYPNSTKQFLPNIEVRLNESVNPQQEEVNIHLLFRPSISRQEAEEFIKNLETEKTDRNGKKVSCAQLSNSNGDNEYEAASVTRESILKAFCDTFGPKAIRQDTMLILAAVNNDGIRPARGVKRKAIITDEIDKFCDAFFGGSQNVQHFLNKNRLEDDQEIKEKPVFSGSDAHSQQQLLSWLGKSVSTADTVKEITWIKADLTYEGLIQTLIEPTERVSINPVMPDEKPGYKVIEKIEFSGTTAFPSEILFNSNLVSIIGSRSSGKSALLNYIAHSIDKEGTEEKTPGPAANKTWDSINFSYSVLWSDGSRNNSGKVIFLPQNYLYNLSSRPEEITEKIKPVLFTKFPNVFAQYEATKNAVDSCNESLSNAVNLWFQTQSEKKEVLSQIKSIGDKTIIQNAIDVYQTRIDAIKSTLSLTDKEVEDYQKISLEISAKLTRQQSVKNELSKLDAQYFINSGKPIDFKLQFTFNPSLNNLSGSVKEKLDNLISDTALSLKTQITDLIINHKVSLEKSFDDLSTEVKKSLEDNRQLIAKNKQNQELSKLIDQQNKQKELLTRITGFEAKLAVLEQNSNVLLSSIEENISSRFQSLRQLEAVVQSLSQSDSEIVFSIESGFSSKSISELSEMFNLKEVKDNPFIHDDCINIELVRKTIKDFLEALETSQIKIKSSQDKRVVAITTICATEEVRFAAIMEGDKIGGFSPSSMTPGKQALFALTLILDEANDTWPLLIDQPEDDLDSRSIYKYIANYIKAKKKERQIIMVSHNANLVLGADSEQLIVANKHGDDRKNRNNQIFDYCSGSLENSFSFNESEYILESCGIREHACEILDGGQEAFEKRKNKYKL